MSEFDRCSAWLEAALEHSIGGWTLADVREQIEAGQATLWPAERSVALTQINTYPRGRVLEVVLAGGDGDELVSVTLPKLRAEAREQGCVQIHAVGRLGWDRRLRPHGFTPIYTVLSLEIA